MTARAFISLGSNLGDPRAQIDAAFDALAGIPESKLVKRSPSYRNRALGPGRQPDFINAVAELDTGPDPFALLDALQGIEAAQGRDRSAERWTSRVIDLDVLLFDKLQMSDDRLTLPHPELHRRRFVLQPLSDIAPDLEIPGRGPLRQLLERAPAHDLEKIASTPTEVEPG